MCDNDDMTEVRTTLYRGVTITRTPWTRNRDPHPNTRGAARRYSRGTVTETRWMVGSQYLPDPGYAPRGYMRLRDAKTAIDQRLDGPS